MEWCRQESPYSLDGDASLDYHRSSAESMSYVLGLLNRQFTGKYIWPGSRTTQYMYNRL